MTTQFRLKKFEDYEQCLQDYPKHIHEVFDFICERADCMLQEEVKELAEKTYREGFMDGLKLYCWLVDRTY